MAVEKSPPKISQINFGVDEAGVVTGVSVHVTYGLYENGRLLSQISETTPIEGLSLADFRKVTAAHAVMLARVIARDEAIAAQAKA